MLTLEQHQTIANLVKSDLQPGKKITFLVTSNSMKPLIEGGDSVIVQVIQCDEVKPGDVIVIQRSDEFMTHRAIKLHENGWITKGDSNLTIDPVVPFHDIIGQVKVVRKNRNHIDLDDRKWRILQPILAQFGWMEYRAFLYHRTFRVPFRILTKALMAVSIRI
jgi:signal peptidase I